MAETVRIDPRNCVPVVDSLVERDLLSREIDSRYRRRRVLRVTGKGQPLAEGLHALNAEREAELLSPLSARKQGSLRRILVTIVDAATPEG